MKLYELGNREGQKFSPPCWRIRLALELRNVAFESHVIGYTDIPVIQGPNKEVFTMLPVFCNESIGLQDSWEIIHYLNRIYAAKEKFFHHASEEAQCLYMQKVMDDIHKKSLKLLALDIYESLQEKDKDYFRTSREKRLGMPLEEFVQNADSQVLVDAYTIMDAYLSENAFFGGDAPNYADITVLSHIQLPLQIGSVKPLLKLPSIAQWLENCAKVLPSLKVLL